jgi:hypothetical protein
MLSSAGTASWSNDQTASIPLNAPPEKAGKRRWSGNSAMIVNQNAASNLDRGAGQARSLAYGEALLDGFSRSEPETATTAG